MSKVIDYLRPNIPRILINREVVHPKHANDEEAQLESQIIHGESDFRTDYVFDAYMLGYCDDVTRILGRLLFSDDTNHTDKSIDTTHHTNHKGHHIPRSRKIHGKLLATLQDDENDEFCVKDWKLSTKVPHERVFLFPGAHTSSSSSAIHQDDINQLNKEKMHEPLYREVVYCDGCTQRICGIVQKCVSCFDYDLCQQCYPKLSKTHHDGKHHFIAEMESGSWER
jgi:Zinc finger, ZZ type